VVSRFRVRREANPPERAAGVDGDRNAFRPHQGLIGPDKPSRTLARAAPRTNPSRPQASRGWGVSRVIGRRPITPGARQPCHREWVSDDHSARPCRATGRLRASHLTVACVQGPNVVTPPTVVTHACRDGCGSALRPCSMAGHIPRRLADSGSSSDPKPARPDKNRENAFSSEFLSPCRGMARLMLRAPGLSAARELISEAVRFA